MFYSIRKIFRKYFLIVPADETIGIIRNLILWTLFIILFLYFISNLDIRGFPGRNTVINFISLYNPKQDGGYLEFFQDILLLWTTIITFKIVSDKRLKKAWYISWIYMFILFDDFFRLHDGIIGSRINNFYIKNNINEVISLIRSKDLAEFSYWIIPIISILLLTFFAINNANKICISLIIGNLIFFLTLGLFGIFLDIIHASILFKFVNSSLNELIILIEEFGEALTITFAFLWNFNFYIVNKKKSF